MVIRAASYSKEIQYNNVPQNKPANKETAGDNIFAGYARKAGMDGFADFLRDDWSAKTARKAGFNNLADWLEDENTNIFKEAVKHPVITLAAITAAVFAGKKVYDYIKSNNLKHTVEKPPAFVRDVAPEPVKNAAEQIEECNKVIEEGLKYEKEIGFKNLEIFKNASDKERTAIINYYERVGKEKDLLLFASGNKPAVIENMGSATDDLFDCLNSQKVNVAEFILSGNGNLVLNKDAAIKVISENRLLFTTRLGLPQNTGVSEIYKQISRSFNNPLGSKEAFADLKELLLGTSKENAYYAQILQDIKNSEKFVHCDIGRQSFYRASAEGIEPFKQALKNGVKSKNSSYSCMGGTFIDKLLKLIDSITSKEYGRRLEEPAKFFADSASEQRELVKLKDLVRKLEAAQKFNAKIGF